MLAQSPIKATRRSQGSQGNSKGPLGGANAWISNTCCTPSVDPSGKTRSTLPDASRTSLDRKSAQPALEMAAAGSSALLRGECCYACALVESATVAGVGLRDHHCHLSSFNKLDYYILHI